MEGVVGVVEVNEEALTQRFCLCVEGKKAIPV